MNKNTNIIVCGQKFDTGVRVVLWSEEEGMSLYPYGKFHARNWSLKEAQKHIKSLYFHHSVTYFAESTFRGLKARGLSCNFVIDDNIDPDTGCSTIYQLLDVKDGGYSQGGIHNHDGAGIEVSFYPDAWDHPNRYNEYNIKKWGVQKHKVVEDTIHGHKFSKVFAPTDAQVEACIKLAGAYLQAFPDIKPEFPRDDNGDFISTTVASDKRNGLMHHFNVKRSKIDTMGFPTDYVEQEVKKILFTKKKSPLTRGSIIALLKKFANMI